MGNPLFSAEELAALAAFDAEIDADDELTLEEYAEAAQRDKQAELAARDNKYRSRAAYQRAYREANKDEDDAKQRAYREANKNEIAAEQRAYREANKNEIAA
jgi:hypothetical protein